MVIEQFSKQPDKNELTSIADERRESTERNPVGPVLKVSYVGGSGDRQFKIHLGTKTYDASLNELMANSFFQYNFELLNSGEAPQSIVDQLSQPYLDRAAVYESNERAKQKIDFNFEPNQDLTRDKIRTGKLYENVCCYLIQRLGDFVDDFEIRVEPTDAKTDAFKGIDFRVELEDRSSNIKRIIPFQLSLGVANNRFSQKYLEGKKLKLETINDNRSVAGLSNIQMLELFKDLPKELSDQINLDKNMFAWLYATNVGYSLLTPVHYFFRDIEGGDYPEVFDIIITRLVTTLFGENLSEKNIRSISARLRSRMSKEVRDRTKFDIVYVTEPPMIQLKDRIAYLDSDKILRYASVGKVNTDVSPTILEVSYWALNGDIIIEMVEADKAVLVDKLAESS